MSIAFTCAGCGTVVMLPLMPGEASYPDDPPVVSIEEAAGWTKAPLRCPECSKLSGHPSAPDGLLDWPDDDADVEDHWDDCCETGACE